MNTFVVHDVQPFSSSSFNTTHYIRHLSFGTNKLYGNIKINPLDDKYSVAKEGKLHFLFFFQYFFGSCMLTHVILERLTRLFMRIEPPNSGMDLLVWKDVTG